ncbi:MAG TPA: TolC family protein [Pyrinomonadaceae bacterium]|nr:TolC family protein [Pyrinomonadaceae bacterium]
MKSKNELVQRRRSRKVIPFALVVFLVSISSVVCAQTPNPAPTPSPSPQNLMIPAIAPEYRAEQKPLPELGRVGVDMNRQKPLPLSEALSMAPANNKDIEVARENVKIAEFDLEGTQGAFDPRFSALTFYERVKTPISSFLSGGSNGLIIQSDFTTNVRLEGLSKFGGNYRLDFSSIRQTTNNQFTGFSPQFPTALTFNYTQPMLRGLSIDNSRRQIEIARKNLSLSDAQFRQRAIEIITSVQRAYWDLVFALRNLQIQRDAVTDARAQLEHNRRLVSEGQLAPIDIVAAEAQVAGVEQNLFGALEEVSRTENSLKNLIASDRQAPIWTSSVIPTDPVDLDAPVVALPEALRTALENRPELQQSNIARDINEIDRRYFADQTKPEVNLIGSYGVLGLAGSINSNAINPFASTTQLRDRVNILSQIAGLPLLPTPPPQTFPSDLIGGYNQSLQNLFGNQFNNFRVGVQISLPLRNRTAEAALGRSLVEEERINTLRQQLEQSIQVEVRNSLQAVRSAEARLRAAAAARNANEQQYQSEQRKLDAGESTVFLVLERQTALTTARGNELRAQTDLNKAIAELQRATGNALSVNSIVVRVR